MQLTRRAFVQSGGALFVSLALPFDLTSLAAATDDAAAPFQTPPPTPATPQPVANWIELRQDETILVRTGRTEIGTGMSAFYVQVVAEELRVRPESITLLMGDTDSTPDGGFSAGFLTGADNLRKAAAYTYQALIGLAAARLGVPATELTVKDGVVSALAASGSAASGGAVSGSAASGSAASGSAAGGRSVRFGELLRGQQLDLRIPVTGTAARMDPKNYVGIAGLDGLTVAGDPPTRAIRDYTIVGTSYPMPGTPDKIAGRTEWVGDVRLPDMLHARLVRPATVGSTLITVGRLDANQFPTASIVRKENFLAVVSPDEWEAVSAAQALAASTKWSDWAGLPGSDRVTQTIRAHPWSKPDERRGDAAAVRAALAKAARRIDATYEQPYVKHAPIGPHLAVADVRRDGVTIWTHASQLQGLRAQIAHLLGRSQDEVVIRNRPHAAQFGRRTHTADGPEADAAILSQHTGKPVRVQWTLPEDLAWSASSPAWVADLTAGLGVDGRIAALHSAFYSPHMFDSRHLGALLAGMPRSTFNGGGWIATEWVYDKIPLVCEEARAMPNPGAALYTGGLRGNIMRTPGQRQQNFALEALVNEAAALAQADPIQFRIDHTSEPRLIDLLRATAKAAHWDPRPSPRDEASRHAGDAPLTGRGVAIMKRTNGYWAGIAEVSVTPSTGVVRVTRFTLGAECGKIINPRQLDRCMKGGLVMGLGEALKEEMTFDRSRVTSIDWSRYQMLTMAEMPEIEIVQISRDDRGFGAGGEAPNAIAPPAVAAAFFDATGVAPRRIPLTPAYVQTLLAQANRAVRRR